MPIAFIATLAWGIVTMWVPGRWALAVFQIAIFAMAAVCAMRRARFHPVCALLAACALWGVVQIAAGWTVEASRTLESILTWTTNAAAFFVAVNLYCDPQPLCRKSVWGRSRTGHGQP